MSSFRSFLSNNVSSDAVFQHLMDHVTHHVEYLSYEIMFWLLVAGVAITVLINKYVIKSSNETVIRVRTPRLSAMNVSEPTWSDPKITINISHNPSCIPRLHVGTAAASVLNGPRSTPTTPTKDFRCWFTSSTAASAASIPEESKKDV
jgi:hypothetical protein